MRKQPDRFKFVLLFGLIISIPLAINYYIFKLLVTFFISSISWDYSLMELLFVSITSIFGGLFFGAYVRSKRTTNVNV
ncbi:hypothetical protein [Oceanobacillus caeni]|uniref:hypothetical protein n=1 Tax=Oceanobacillus caeni TaxID=405946 RepID=UPI001957B9B0